MKAIGTHNVQPKSSKERVSFFGNTQKQNFFQKKEKRAFFPEVQTKLELGKPRDKYEVEADAMADQVVQNLQQEQSNGQPFFSPVNPVSPLQTRSNESAGDEVQKVEEDPAEDEIQLKESTKDIIQPKGEPAKADTLERQINSSKGAGAPLAANTRQTMESAFNADFSNVKVHTDSQAMGMNKSLHAQAFTHGSDIYFNEGKYNPGSTTGQHLLAHELTHVEQQNKPDIQCSILGSFSPGDTRDFIQDLLPCLAEGTGIEDLLKDPRLSKAASIFATVNSMINASYISQQVNIMDPFGLREKLRRKAFKYLKEKLMNLMGNETIELKGKATFEPDYLLQLYICLRSQKDNFIPIKVRFGNLGQGLAYIRATNQLGIYNSAPTAMLINHKAFDLSESEDVLALNFEISNNKISGELGITSLREFVVGFISSIPNPVKLYSDKLDKAVLGKDKDNAIPLPGVGGLSNGKLFLLHSALINGGNSNFIISLLHLDDENYIWQAPIQLDVAGINSYTLEVERTPSGLLAGEATDLELNGTWTGKGFVLEGELRASYLNGTFEIRGNAKYTSARATGKVSLLVTDYENAQKAATANLPESARVHLKEEASRDTAVMKNTNKRLALTGWGELNLNVVVGTFPLVADAGFVVSPDGFISTAGIINMPGEYFLTHTPLLKEKSFSRDIVKLKIPVKWGSIELSLSAGLDIGGMIGPLRLFNLQASGFYSDNPVFEKINRELSLSADLDIFGNAWARAYLNAEGAIKLAGLLTAVSAGGKLQGNASFNAFIKASPKITYTAGEDISQYMIKGILHAGGELLFELEGEIYIDVLRIFKTKKGKEERTWQKHFSLGKWTLGEFGFEAVLAHVLGSGELPSLNFNKTKFNRKALAQAMISGKKQAEKERKQKLAGGFKQEEGGKVQERGVFSDEENLTEDKVVAEISPYQLEEPFSMNGKKHLLRLEISGTEETPVVSLNMYSTRHKLLDKIEDEKILIQMLLNSSLLMNALTADQEKILNLRIRDLNVIKEEAFDIVEAASQLAQDLDNEDDFVVPGFEQLDDQISTYGEKYETRDLGISIGSPTQEITPTDKDLENLPPELTNLKPGDLIKEKTGTVRILKFSSIELRSGEVVFMAETLGGHSIFLKIEQYLDNWWLAPKEIKLILPSSKAVHQLRYQKLIDERLLIHSKNRPERKTNQREKWDRALRQVPHPNWSSPGPNAMSEWAWHEFDKYNLSANRKLRPYWSKTKKYQHPMQVDHVIEWQVTPLGQADIYDDYGNFELLDQPTNSSSGNDIKNNIITIRKELVRQTKDEEWYSLDLIFTELVVPGSSKGERWSEQEIEAGEHIYSLKKLLGEPD